MLSCKDLAKKTLSEGSYTFKEKVERWIHLKICHTCRIFQRQMENLDHSLRKGLKKDFDKHHKAREDLKEKLLKEAKKYQ
jgi:hypothetical protein